LIPPSSPSFVIPQQSHNKRAAASSFGSFPVLCRLLFPHCPGPGHGPSFLDSVRHASCMGTLSISTLLRIEPIKRIAHVHSQHQMLGGGPGIAMRTAAREEVDSLAREKGRDRFLNALFLRAYSPRIHVRLSTTLSSNPPVNRQVPQSSPRSAVHLDHPARVFIHSPQSRPLPRRFTRAYRLAPVDVVFSISRRVLDKDPSEHTVTFRTAQEIMHVYAPSTVA
jgi:hypothetical protein